MRSKRIVYIDAASNILFFKDRYVHRDGILPALLVGRDAIHGIEHARGFYKNNIANIAPNLYSVNSAWLHKVSRDLFGDI